MTELDHTTRLRTALVHAVPRARPLQPVRERDLAGSLRILYVTPRYFPFMGGVESHVDEVARRMARDGHQVTVLTANLGGRLPEQDTVAGVTIRRVRAYPADRDYYLAPGMFREITRGKWDVVHVQSYHTLVAPLGMFAARLAGIPYVVTFHGGGHSSAMRNAARKYQRFLLRPLLAGAARLVAVANFERTLFQEQLALPQEKFAVIPNGADLPRIEPVTAEYAPTSDGTIWIASIGRLEPYKGHQHVIAALPHLLRVQPKVRLWIAGTGPYADALREQANELGVGDRVRIEAIPPNERERMARELARVSLVTLLSEYETHPIAVLEALALKRPVLVSETSGLKELVERGYACGIAPGAAPAEVATAMQEQLEHPFVPATLDLPTWDDCAADLLHLYHDVLGAMCQGGNSADSNACPVLPADGGRGRTACAGPQHSTRTPRA